MADFLCTRDCQALIKGGKITFISHGTVLKAKDNPKKGCFIEIEGEEHKLDFTTASEEELEAATWTHKEAATALLKAYKIKLIKKESDTKATVIERIMDIRYRNNKDSKTPEPTG